MNWNHLFDMQAQLDKHIQQNHRLEAEDLTGRKILAFQVELGELANETRCFKFWSLKPPSPPSVILEEYVDGLHFLLSLGLSLGYRFDQLEEVPAAVDSCDQFQRVYRAATYFERETSAENYHQLFQEFMALAVKLGLTPEGVMEAYVAKNTVNFQRQDEGY
ncbi:dUTP diphosphatase [Anoxynatronum buryatiense]|uniref:Dimeric dUTPase, all-alpha-NTP-PPase (MazG) superfamily n=1 Tax=Anoxynatronum buryatiense TaxID=489973 RepID=A0AA45WXZ5_9CLOT|nr:dUTP diphosphatase [Anoxynatronum buryatiense]SMP66591.1 Dimeric dUTPase, all-alpha-NTP-PPase (MazG) superfamily [Anoxynatronum buryatiense]